ncbi:MAG: hypothetical protein FWG65_01185, partial [Turicibacter sp.]|nr:hypothetical protein [Turicibacter sp.]
RGELCSPVRPYKSLKLMTLILSARYGLRADIIRPYEMLKMGSRIVFSNRAKISPTPQYQRASP